MSPVFVDVPVSVRVPASSANLGPGFDAMGLGLDTYDDLTVTLDDTGGYTVDVAGEGEGVLPSDERHLVVAVMLETFDLMGGRPAAFRLSTTNRIPHGRGLGSSAAAIVAGVLLARGCVVGGAGALSDEAVLEQAAAREGHPDNVAAALLGGLTIAWTDDSGDRRRSRAVRLEPDPAVAPVAFVPDGSLSTSTARRLLPATVPHADAAFNAGRAGLLVAALTGRTDLLLAATEDRLHQGYRAEAMPASAALVARLRGMGVAAVVSGAGPTVLALCTDDDVDVTLDAPCPGFRPRRMRVAAGAEVTLGDAAVAPG